MLTKDSADDQTESIKSKIQRLENTLNNLNNLFAEVEILDQFDLTVAPNKLSNVDFLHLINKNFSENQASINKKQVNIHITSNSADTQLTSNPVIANHIVKTSMLYLLNQSSECARIKVSCEKKRNTFEMTLCELHSNEINTSEENSHPAKDIPLPNNPIDLSQAKLLANLLGGELLVEQNSSYSSNSLKIIFVDFALH